jgi:glycerol dehydrogenase-like iron-containing ADH family enzyme
MGDLDIPKKSRGLGDTVAKITKATGIKTAVDTVNKALGRDCACKERQSKLNKIFPYQKPTKTKGFFE